MKDIECPYCGQELEINHDDGFGYEDGVRHKMRCDSCYKSFVFDTSITYSHEAYIADCLNGSPHDWGVANLIFHCEDKNKELWHRFCRDCEKREQEYNPSWKTIKE